MQTLPELIGTGLQVTLIGMGVVFALLALLVGLVYVMSAFCARFAVEGEPIPTAPADNDAIIGVISAAVHRYRRTHGLDK